MPDDSRAGRSLNELLEATSFLYGANAPFIEREHAKFAENPGSVGAEWRAFFQSLGERAQDVAQNARGPSWQKKGWPIDANGEWTSALTSDWGETRTLIKEKIEEKAAEGGITLNQEALRAATLDSIRALMLIRAYRIRGHLMADLDPLHLEPLKINPELDPATYGFTEADLDRPIFIDRVLGLETATMREMLDILRRT